MGDIYFCKNLCILACEKIPGTQYADPGTGSFFTYLFTNVKFNSILCILNFFINISTILYYVSDCIGQCTSNIIIICTIVNCGNFACKLNNVFVYCLSTIEIRSLIVNIRLCCRQIAGNCAGVRE